MALLGCLLSAGQAWGQEAKKGKVEVTVIETDLGADQPVRRGGALARREPDVTIKPSIQWGEGTAAPAKAKKAQESVEVDSAQIIQVNHSVLKLIEENERLQHKVGELDDALKALRGQYTLDLNRFNQISIERDAYKQQSERIEQMKQQYEQDMANYQKSLEEREQVMAAKVQELQGQLNQAIIDERTAQEKKKFAARHKPEGELEAVDVEPEQDVGAVNTAAAPSDSGQAVPGPVNPPQTVSETVTPPQPVETMPAVTPDQPPVEIAATRGPEHQPFDPGAFPGRGPMHHPVDPRANPEPSPEPRPVDPPAVPVPSPEPKPVDLPVAVLPEPSPQPVEPAVVQPAPAEQAESRDLPASSTQATLADQSKGFDVMAMIENISEQSRKMSADEAKIHYNMGNIYFKQGDNRKALEEFQKAVKLMPGDANAHFNLAFTAEALHDYQTARDHYEQYLFLNPGADDSELVKGKIVEASLFLRNTIDSTLEKDLTRHWNRDE